MSANIITSQSFEESIFPFSESSTMEFKENFIQKAFGKYLETLCGFLNTRGGYLIFGVKDNLDPVGMNLKGKLIDQCLCRIDSIISGGFILMRNNETNQVSKLFPAHIQATQFKNSQGKIFLVIEAVPNKPDAGDYKFQLSNGMIFYRLGASNYFEKAEKIFRQSDFESQFKQIEKNFHQENLKNIHLFEQTLKEKEKKIQELSRNIQNLKQENSIYSTHLSTAVECVNNRNLASESSSLIDFSSLWNPHQLSLRNLMSIAFPCLK